MPNKETKKIKYIQTRIWVSLCLIVSLPFTMVYVMLKDIFKTLRLVIFGTVITRKERLDIPVKQTFNDLIDITVAKQKGGN